MEQAVDGQTAKTFAGPAGNQYEELKLLREGERLSAIKQGLIDDPDRPKSLDQATIFLGTCTEMCPRYEREQREYQNNVERWELDPATGRIDPARAVKAFHRPAAGNEQALPSDVRPPAVLVSTLDYLLDNVLCGPDALELTHGFIRDRTRSIRQDFTLQNDRGPEAILCHERIARFHIASLHLMRSVTGFSEQQETEQLRKTLQSLAEYYNEQHEQGRTSPDEPEFRAYHILTRIRDPDVLRQTQTLPSDILKSRHVQRALRLYNYAQRSNEELGRFKAPNCEGSQHLYARFFRLLESSFTDYLSACLCEAHFTDVRKGALKAMRKAYMPQQSGISLGTLTQTLGFDDDAEAQDFLEHFGIAATTGEDGTARIELHKNSFFDESDVFTLQHTSKRLVEVKRAGKSLSVILRGSNASASFVPIAPLKRRATFVDFDRPSGVKELQRSAIGASVALSQPQPSLSPKRPAAGPTPFPFALSHESEPRLQVTKPALPSISIVEPVVKAASQIMFSQSVREHLKDELGNLVQENETERRKRTLVLQSFASELCLGLLKDQMAIAVSEQVADSRRRRSLLRVAFKQITLALERARRRRVAATVQAEAERKRQQAYCAAQSLLQRRPTRSLKRSHSWIAAGEIARPEEIHQIKSLAERFWMPVVPSQHWSEIASQTSIPLSLFVSVDAPDSPSSRWLSKKLELFNAPAGNLACKISQSMPSEPVRRLAGLLFECTGDISQSRDRLIQLLQHFAVTSSTKFVLLVICFETADAAHISANLNLEAILSDPRTPVQSAWFACMARMDQVDDFHTVLEKAMAQTDSEPGANEQLRVLGEARGERIQAVAFEPRKQASSRPRSSFYDSSLMPLQPSLIFNRMTNVTLHEAKGSSQTSALMRAIAEAKQTLSWAAEAETGRTAS